MKRFLPTAAWALTLACAGPAPSPEEADLAYREAIHLLSRSADPAEAAALLDRAVRGNPGRADFFTARALVRRLQHRPEEAAADITAAIRIQRQQGASAGDLATSLLNRALLSAALNRPAEAGADFDEAIRVFPDYVEAYLHRARFRRQAGRDEEARRDTEEARRRGSALADTFYNEGARLIGLGRAGEAERSFECAVELNPEHVQAHVGLGRARMELRRFDPAVQAFCMAIALKPGDAELRYHRGNAFLAGGKYAEAFDDYTRAIELDSGHAGAHAMRGVVHHRHFKDREKAERDYTRSIELDPQSPVAHLDRGLLYHEMGLLQEAERDIARSLTIHATAEGFRFLGRVLHDRGEYDRADHAFRQALLACHDGELRKSIEDDRQRTREAKEKDR